MAGMCLQVRLPEANLVKPTSNLWKFLYLSPYLPVLLLSRDRLSGSGSPVKPATITRVNLSRNCQGNRHDFIHGCIKEMTRNGRFMSRNRQEKWDCSEYYGDYPPILSFLGNIIERNIRSNVSFFGHHILKKGI